MSKKHEQTQADEDAAMMAQAKADTLAADEAAADEYGRKMAADEVEPTPKAEPEAEPQRFTTGGAPFHEIEAWRAEHGA